MHVFQIDRLEERRLLSGGLSTVGQPVTVASIASQFAYFATCPVGTADTLIAYIKNGTVDGIVIDSSGNTLVPEFAISSQADNVNQFGRMAAVQDSNGNAVVVYSTQFGENVNAARVSSSGQIVNQSTMIMQSASSSFQTPAVAAGPNGDVAVVAASPSTGGNSSGLIVAGVFDSSDNAKFTPININAPSSNAPGGALLTSPSVVFVASTGNYLAAWDEEDLTIGDTADTQELINDNTFSSAGIMGQQNTIDTAPNTSTTDNVLRRPFLDGSASGDAFEAYYVEDNYGPAPSYTFGGSDFFGTRLSPDGAPTAERVKITSAPTSEQLALDSVMVESQVASAGNTIRPLDATGVGGILAFMFHAFDPGASVPEVVHTGALDVTSASLPDLIAIVTKNDSVAADNDLNVTSTFSQNGVLTSSGIVYSPYDSSTTTTTIVFQSTQFTTPTGGGGGGGGGGNGTLTPTMTGSLPTSGIAGQKLKASEKVTLTNSSGSTVSGAETVALYLSTSTSADSSSIALPESASGSVNAKNGKTAHFNFKITSLPSSVPAGTYHVVAKCTDPGGGIATIASSGTIMVAAARVDLSGTFSNAPVSVPHGKKSTAVIAVTESGNVPVTGILKVNASVAVFSNQSDVVSQETISKTIKLKVGKPVQIKLPGVVPATLDAGDYVLIVQLDPDNALGDVDLSNNTFSSSQFTVMA